MSKIQFVTSFVDIGRGNWNSCYKRSNEKYINDFIAFYSGIEINLSVFCNNQIKQQILEKIDENFKTNITFEIIEKKDLHYLKLSNQISVIQHSEKMKTYAARDNTKPPEYFDAEYVAMMFAKTEIMKLAFEKSSKEIDNFAWIDFGIAGGSTEFISATRGKSIKNLNNDKIILFKRQDIELSTDPFFYSNLSDNVLICGGIYVLPRNLVLDFFEKFQKIVSKFIENEIIDDDQTMLAIFAAENLDHCNVISSVKYKNNPYAGDWFPIFELFDNKE